MFVINNYSFIKDSKISFLEEALSPLKVNYFFYKNLPNIFNKYQLTQIRVIRYKPQKRCLIEYTFEGENTLTLIGKIRAKGTDYHSYNLQQKLWNNGFNNDCRDKISVPEPMAIIPEWQMWLQKKVSGKVLTDLFSPTIDIEKVKKIAHVAHKLHQLKQPTHRRHLIADELFILHQKLPLILVKFPHWEKRIEELLTKCDRLGQTIEENQLCGIHRDFYFDQIIVDKDHFYLLDLDLYCLGNPSLDIGNFIGHISEYSLRKWGDLNKLEAQENALKEEFIRLAGESQRRSIDVYTILTLVRHIYLSTQFPDRNFSTEILFDFCESKLKE